MVSLWVEEHEIVKIFISGICGFVGSELALGLRAAGYAVGGCDNFSRAGSELNGPRLEAAGVEVWRGDVRFEKELERVRGIDWVIDAAANPSVLAGVDGKTSSRELLEHNLWGTVNLLEVCKREAAGMILLSTSRVYSIGALCALPVTEKRGAFVLEAAGADFGPRGITEDFTTAAPVSLYGASKLASEQIALEYGSAFGFPVWVNRCGVMAGAGQFGKPDQGIFSYWIHSWARQAPLKYIGFGGTGHQVRDCLHPGDLVDLVLKQMERGAGKERDEGGDLRPEVGGAGGEGGKGDEGGTERSEPKAQPQIAPRQIDWSVATAAQRDRRGARSNLNRSPLRRTEIAGGKPEVGEIGDERGQGTGDGASRRQPEIGDRRPEDEKTESGKVGMLESGKVAEQRIFNVSGGITSAMSLRQLSDWSAGEFGGREVAVDLTPRAFDLPWVVLDSARAEAVWDWRPRRTVGNICEEIARHAREHPEWLALSGR